MPSARLARHIPKSKSDASRSVEVKSSSVIWPTLSPRSITVSSPSWVIVRLENPLIEEIAERSILSVPLAKSVIVSFPSPECEYEVIGSRAAREYIVARAADDLVVALTAVDVVRARAAVDRVVALAAIDFKSPSAPPSMVSEPFAAGQKVVARAAVDGVVALFGEDSVVATQGGECFSVRVAKIKVAFIISGDGTFHENIVDRAVAIRQAEHLRGEVAGGVEAFERDRPPAEIGEVDFHPRYHG